MGPNDRRCWYIVPCDVTGFTKGYLDAEVPAISFGNSTSLAIGVRERMRDWQGDYLPERLL